MKNKNVCMTYVGSEEDLVVLEDKTNKLINLCCHSADNKEIELWSFNKKDVEVMKRPTLFEKTIAYFVRSIINYSDANKELYESKVKLQTFPLSFWNEFIIPVKQGKLHEFTIQML